MLSDRRLPCSDMPPAPALTLMLPGAVNVTPRFTVTELPASRNRLCPDPVSVTDAAATRLFSACTVTSPLIASSVAGATVSGAPLLLMVRSPGSIRMRPVRPLGAAVLTPPPRLPSIWPDSSTLPPSPPWLPPRAETVPSITVLPPDRTVTWPPLPRMRALAERRAPGSTTVLAVVAWPRSAGLVARASVAPTPTIPPPAPPSALIRAVLATVSAPVAFSATWPPAPAPPSAATRPSIRTEPPTPAMAMLPVRLPKVFAWMRPPASTRFCTMPSAAAAVICTMPPSATMKPVLVTSAVTGLPSAPRGAWRTCRVTSMDSRPSP